MLVVDTSVWSLAMRRTSVIDTPHVERFRTALADGEVLLPGIVFQEVLQGLADGTNKDRLVVGLAKLRLLRPTREDHRLASDCFNDCRRNGVQLATVDALIAALCIRRSIELLSTDRDFVHAAPHIGLTVWGVENG